MRIALINRSHSDPGGDAIAILALKRALEKRSHYVWLATERFTAKDLRGFDIAHVQHVQFGWALENIAHVRAAGIPYLLVPMWYPPKEYSGYDHNVVADAVSSASRICPFSENECDDLIRSWGMAKIREGSIQCIPNGTDPRFHSTKPHAQRQGVIAVSARPGKGEDHVARACKELGLPFHFVTGTAHDALPAVYANARVFVNASGGERMSLTTGEALCAGCRVIDTIHNRGNEWYPWIVKNIPGILGLDYLIDRAYNDPEWNYEPNEAARKLTWDHVAELYEGAYLKCLK